MPKYKVEMIVEVIDGHPRKWIAETVEMALEDGEDILSWSVEEIEDEAENDEIGSSDSRYCCPDCGSFSNSIDCDACDVAKAKLDFAIGEVDWGNVEQGLIENEKRLYVERSKDKEKR